MEGYSREEVKAEAARVSEEMFNAVQLSFGPEGQAVLAQSATRLTITRSGSQILNLVFPRPHPVLSLLLDSANKLHAATGDGVKSFVIVFKALLRQALFKNSPSFVNKLSTLQTQLSLSFPSTCNCVLTNDMLVILVKTFFTTRFSPMVSQTLVSLVVNWVLKLKSITDVDLYVCDFLLLCPKFSPFSVTASCIQDGFLIKGHWARRFVFPTTQCILKVYYHSMDTSPEDGQVEMDITEILNENNDSKNVIFVTNFVLQDRAQYLLNKKNIFFIHGTCSDTAKFLYEQTLLRGQIIVECKRVNDYLWISLPTHQLLLKAPSESLASEYAEGVLDCLKMLNFSFKQSKCTVRAGGLFERALAKKLFDLSINSCQRIPPVESREQLLSWRKTIPGEADLLKHVNFKNLGGFDSEVVGTVCRSLLALQTSDTDTHNFLESVALRLEILCRAISLTVVICHMDGAILKPMKGRLC